MARSSAGYVRRSGFSLEAGEREALLLVQEHPAALLLTDDAAARLVAELMRWRVHGTIGVLIREYAQALSRSLPGQDL